VVYRGNCTAAAGTSPPCRKAKKREYSGQFGSHPGNLDQDEKPGLRSGEAGGYDSRGMSMGDTLRSILTRLVAYVTVAIAIGLLFLAGASVYELMWPRPVVPFSQMSRP
jgi:hypothetical protein